jgi:ABC-type transport system involved in multi-copper enzyme maturation permease subunit
MAKVLKFPATAAAAEPATQALPAFRINHLLPYYAVLQAEMKATLRSWIYRLWVLMSIGAVIGYLMYRFGAKQVAGFAQPAPEMINDLFQWIVWGSVTIIIVLTSGAICGERGTMADSVLSRGISRNQYFMGKWHAKLAVILGTFLVLSLATMIASILLLHSSTLNLLGVFIAIATVASLLTMIITCGVAVSAVANSTVVAITVVWMALYGVGFMLSFLPSDYPSPDRALQGLPEVLKGHYNLHMVGRFIVGSLGLSLFMAVVGMVCFSRKDV